MIYICTICTNSTYILILNQSNKLSILFISIHYISKWGHKSVGHTPMGVWSQIDKWTTLSRTERIKTKSINSTKFLTHNLKTRGVGCEI